MLRFVLFDMNLFEDESDRDNSQKRVLWLLEALTRCNQLYLQNHPDTPLIYKSGIKYKAPAQFEPDDLPEVAVLRKYFDTANAPRKVTQAFEAVAKISGGGEHFREIPRIIENGGGDCDNVASWRAAELRQLGINAQPYITWRKRPDGGTTYHVVVLYPDGTHEDPSLLLGMGGAERADQKLEEQRKLGERVGDLLAGDLRSTFGVDTGRRAPGTTILGTAINSPQDYNQLQYSIPFQTMDAYEDWSPTRPQAFYANPFYQGGLIKQSGPIFNTRMRDPDEMDWEDKYDR